MTAKKYLYKTGKLFEIGHYETCVQLLHDHLLKLENNDFNEKDESQDLVPLKYMIQQNITVCGYMQHYHDVNETSWTIKTCETFASYLQELQGWPVAEEYIRVELIILCNYLCVQLGSNMAKMCEWTDAAWVFIQNALSRAFEVTTGSKASVHRSAVEDATSLIDGIVLHLENASVFMVEAVHQLCYSVLFFLLTQNKPPCLKFIARIFQHFERTNNVVKTELKNSSSGTVCLHPLSVFTFKLPSLNDFEHLLFASCLMQLKDSNESILNIDKVLYPAWKYIVGYMKAFLQYKNCEYDQALKTAWLLWETKQKADLWTLARISNMIGCCLFKKGCYNMAIRWFQKSIKLSSTFHLPLWNISCSFQHQGNSEASLQMLEVLTQICENEKQNFWVYSSSDYLWLPEQPEINYIHAVYLLAQQYTASWCYGLASDNFVKLLYLLKQETLKSLTAIDHFEINQLKIHVEACYVFLHAGLYKDCIKTCETIEHYFLPCNSSHSESNEFSWNINKEAISILPSAISNSSSYYSECGLIFSLFNKENQSVGSSNFTLPISSCEEHENVLHSSKSNENLKQDVYLHIKPLSIVLLLIKASAKYLLNKVDEAKDILERARSLLLNCGMRYSTPSTCKSTKATAANALGGGLPCQETKMLCELCSKMMNPFISQIYNNMAVLCIEKDHLNEAAHYFKMSALYDSGNIDATYNYCLLLIKLGQPKIAQSYWTEGKQNSDVLGNLLTSKTKPILYSVTIEQLKCIDELFSKKS